MYSDLVSYKRIDTLHPLLRVEVRAIVDELNSTVLTGQVKFRLADCYRTFEQQQIEWNKGRTTKGPIVTWAKPGHSYHQYGLAIDGVLLLDKNGDGVYEEASWNFDKDFDLDKIPDWKEVVAIFKKYGWEWGGDWAKNKRDTPHFQKTFGLSINECLTKYANKKFIQGTKYIVI